MITIVENKTYKSESANQTELIAKQIAKNLCGGEFLAMFGSMGMGKTAFARGLAKGLQYKGEVSSPTFAIVHEYLGGRLNIYHFDMYRVCSWDDLYSTNFFEYMESGGIMLTEWSENIEATLPEKYIKIEISRGDTENSRIISVTNIS